ncbi:MAG: T9SS type A sorting domain-containing protein [Bacteroidales bacterium]
MKTTFTLLVLAVFTLGVSAQLQLPETFEAPESDTSWHQFANAGDAPENMLRIDNPVFNGINESEFCLQFIVQPTADPWVGAWSDNFGPIEITDENFMMEMMVYKDVLTKCALKLEAGDGPNVEFYTPNTVTDEWEKLTFDMSAAIGYTYPRLVIFPDFPDTRESGSISLVDNVGFVMPVSAASEQLSGIRIYPNPVAERMTIRYPEMEGAVISNVLGQTVRSLTFQQSNLEVIELTNLKPGLYFITVETAGGPASSKFVKE